MRPSRVDQEEDPYGRDQPAGVVSRVDQDEDGQGQQEDEADHCVGVGKLHYSRYPGLNGMNHGLRQSGGLVRLAEFTIERFDDEEIHQTEVSEKRDEK